MKDNLEIELKRGEPDRLSRVASALQAHFSLLPSTKSKFALGMEQVGPRLLSQPGEG